MANRRVEVAVGLDDGEWEEVAVDIPEDEYCVLDPDEIKEKVEEIVAEISFGANNVAFVHILEVSDPEGGYAEDSW